MEKIVVPFCFIFLFFSCSLNLNNKESASHESIPVAVSPIKKIKECKGVYHPGQFKNAENSELYTFYDSVQRKLDSIYNNLLPNPYPNQTIFLSFKGITDSLPTNLGYRTAVTELISMELKNAFNTLVPYNYWCMGNEPFWQVQISEKENLIDFYDPMIPKFYHFIFSKTEIKEGKTIYTAEENATNNKIKIIITNEKCSDGMSEKKYNYKSEVILNGTVYNGCAMTFGEIIQ